MPYPKKWFTPEEYKIARKKSDKKYTKSEKGILTNKRAQKKYNKTDKNREKARRHYWKHRDEILEKNRGNPVKLESKSKYNKSDKGKASHARYRKTHDPIIDTKEDLVRRACKKRDNYVCQWKGCNETEHLHAHHIFKRSDYPEFKYDLWNLTTYCPFHHFWTHIMNGEIIDAIFVTAFMDASF